MVLMQRSVLRLSCAHQLKVFYQCMSDVVNTAIDEASEAFIECQDRVEGKWEVEMALRGLQLQQAATTLLNDNSLKEKFAQAECKETKRPITETRYSIEEAAHCLQYFGSLAQVTPTGNVVSGVHPSPTSHQYFSFTRREPLGVCAGIGAWNYPLEGMVWKLAPAYITGNSFVFKPDEKTPSTTLMLRELLGDPKAFQVVEGGGTIGEALARDERISKIAFTGSRATGQKVNIAAAECRNLKKVTLELGGKSPLIICEDYDVDEAVALAIQANFYSSGQVCSNGTRVFVPFSLLDKFLNKLLTAVEALKIGDPTDDSVEVGPLIDEAQAIRVCGFIDRAREEGALIHGGKYFMDANGNHFVTPCIATFVEDSMEVAKEEVFGPVMSILTYNAQDPLEDVISRANASEYGLAAGVLTNNLNIAHKFVNKLQAGMVYVNTYNDAPPNLPWGGYKNSGLGRENGIEALQEYTQVKSVCMSLKHNPFLQQGAYNEYKQRSKTNDK